VSKRGNAGSGSPQKIPAQAELEAGHPPGFRRLRPVSPPSPVIQEKFANPMIPDILQDGGGGGYTPSSEVIPKTGIRSANADSSHGSEPALSHRTRKNGAPAPQAQLASSE
jgi:hypothetical protein